ncbi:hypothetical protein Tco_1371548 [Tanacetum coccineum]
MCTYLKNMEGWKPKDLKNKSFANIQELFDKAMKRVNTFVDYKTELVEGSSKKVYAEIAQESSSKRARDELEQESIKEKKVDKDKETVELQSLMQIIPDEYEVAIDAIPLATMPPTIVDWKIYKEGKNNYYQIIRDDGSSKMYRVFSLMLKSFDMQDLEDLYNLVKAKYGSTRLVEDLDLILYGDLKTMFNPHVEDQVWKNQYDYKVLDWKLYDSCGVHSLRIIMNPAIAQQVALVEALVSTDDRLSPCYNAFLITTDIPEIYMQQFWYTISKVKDSSLYQFKLDNKKFKIGVELFCEIIQISLKVPNKEFVAPPPHDAITSSPKLTTGRLVSEDVKTCPIPDSQRLKFIGKYEENQVYGMSIPDVMVDEEIKKSKAYQTYLAFSTRALILKKARKGSKAPATPKKISSVTTDKDIISNPKETKRRPTGVIIKDTPNVSKKKTSDETLKLKGAGITTKVSDEPKGKSRGTSEGASITPEVLNVDDERTESKREVSKSEKYDDKMHEDEELHTYDEGQDDEYVQDDAAEEMKDDKNADEVKNDQVIDDAEKVDFDMIEEEKHDDQQARTNQAAKDNQARLKFQRLRKRSLKFNQQAPVFLLPLLDVLVSVIPLQTNTTPIPTPLLTPPITSEAPIITITIHDPLPAVIQKLLDLEKKFKSWTKVDHSKAIEASIQANLINEVKNQLPKLLLKAVSDLIDKSRSYMSHDKNQELYDALLNSIILDEAIASGNVNPAKVLKKRDYKDDQDPTTG